MAQDKSQTTALVVATETDALANSGRQFDELLAAFLGSLDVADTSRDVYRRRLHPFFSWVTANWGGRPVTREAVLAFKQHLRDQGYAGTSISSYISALRLFFAWAEKVGLAPNIAADITGARISRHHRKDALTESQVVKLLTSLPKASPRDYRDHALLVLLCFCGLRSVEAVRADVGDIRPQDSDMVLWLRGKGHDEKDAFVVLTDEVLTPIMQYLGTRTGTAANEPLFAGEYRSGEAARLSTRTIRRIVKHALRRIDLNSPRLSTHSLRHTAVTLAMRAGAGPYELKEFARHENLQTTLIYMHTARRLDNAAEKKLSKYLREHLDEAKNRQKSGS